MYSEELECSERRWSLESNLISKCVCVDKDVEIDVPVLAVGNKARRRNNSLGSWGGLAAGCSWCSRDDGGNAGEDHRGPHDGVKPRSVSAEQVCWRVWENGYECLMDDGQSDGME